jgi:general secretion pathway protein H
VAPARRRNLLLCGCRQRGFSLLELLVTLIVVVLITSLVTLNVGSGGRGIQLEAQLSNLVDVASYALDEAQMLGVDYGLVLYQLNRDGEQLYGYSWRERRPEGWRVPVELAPDLELRLELEGVPLADLALQDGGDEATPQVILYASGETTAGAIDVQRRDSGELLWRLEWDMLGRFSLLLRGEPEEDS